MEQLGLHDLICRKSQGRHFRQTAIIKRSLGAAKIPAQREPSTLRRFNDKHPDDATFTPWRKERILVWDATCPDTLAPSCTTFLSGEQGDVANRAEALKREKYADISATHHFVPLGIETTGMFGVEAKELLLEVGRRVMEESGESRSYDYLLQRISIAVQQRNVAQC